MIATKCIKEEKEDDSLRSTAFRGLVSVLGFLPAEGSAQ